MDLAFDDIPWYMVSLGLDRGYGAIFKYFMCSNDFIPQKVYFSRIIQVFVILIMVAACI